MANSLATDKEKLIISDLIHEAWLLVPNTKIRYIKRVQEPGEIGLLVGVRLPSEIPSNNKQVLLLQDVCEAQSHKHKLPIGLSMNQLNEATGCLDLSFLPPDILVPESESMNMHKLPIKGFIVAAVIVLISLVVFIVQKQNTSKSPPLVVQQHTPEKTASGHTLYPIIQKITSDEELALSKLLGDSKWLKKKLPVGEYEVAPEGRGDIDDSSETIRRSMSKVRHPGPIIGENEYKMYEECDKAGFDIRGETLGHLDEYREYLRATGQNLKAARVEKMMQALP